ncbi:MAG: hypothetical protein Q8S00_29355 [Deltaproteobacteria bacterium]|nr:hypothetical protein [Deltaproteobacteria bacterium]
MRNDEEFVKDCLLEFLGQGAEAVPGEEPPDYYFIIDGARIAVEVSQLTPVSYDKKGRVKNRLTEDSYSMDLCDELDRKFRSRFHPNLALLLHIHGPIKQPRTFRKQMERLIEAVAGDQRVKIGWRRCYDVAGEKVRVIAIPPRLDPYKKILGIIDNRDSAAYVGVNAQIILGNRILAKQATMAKKSWNGPKWLVLLNQYWLADAASYRQDANELGIEHDFERVFLVEDTGRVACLIDRT